MHRNQLLLFLGMLVVYALIAFVSYAFFMDQLLAAAGMKQMPSTGMSPLVLGLANAGFILVVYGLLAGRKRRE